MAASECMKGSLPGGRRRRASRDAYRRAVEEPVEPAGDHRRAWLEPGEDAHGAVVLVSGVHDAEACLLAVDHVNPRRFAIRGGDHGPPWNKQTALRGGETHFSCAEHARRKARIAI